LAACAEPIEPDAPGLFSTINCCFSDSLSFTPTSRASGSTEPPGGNGTISFTGFVGHSCAAAGAAASAASATSKPRIVATVVFIALL
jgi:hypothetical protein